MIKYLVIIIAVFGLSTSGVTQHTIKGRLIDEDNEPLSYATVALLNPADSILKYFGVTNNEGKYQIKNIKYDEYLMQYSFVGKITTYEEISLSAESPEDFGDKIMKPTMLDEIIVVAEYVPVQFKGDTVEFDTKAFTVKPNAVVEDLLKKIPGIEVDETGNVKALGEDVTKVLVDGKEFFDKDPKVATKNLPADAIEKVQVFDKKSEEAEFMGIDDGVRERTINLLLNEDSKEGYFGNVEAGGGTGEHYKIGAKLYRFSSTIQAAILGMYNNVNEFGYTGHSSAAWGQQIKGHNKTAAGGLNLSYNGKEINRYYLSYLGSSRKKNLEQKTNTENYLKDGTFYQGENLDEEERNSPHKFNFGVRHNFNKKHKLIVNGDINISSNKNNGKSLTITRTSDSLINKLNNKTITESNLSNAYAKAVYIGKLNKEKTQLKTNLTFYYDKSKSLLDWNDTIKIYHPDSLGIYYQSQHNNTDNLSLSINPTLIQKIKNFWYFSVGIKVGANYENLSREQEIINQGGNIKDTIIPHFKTDELVIGPSISIKRSSAKSQLSFILGTSLNRFDKVFDNNSIGEKEYFYILPGFSYTNSYRTGRRLGIRYTSNVNMPNVNQLFPVINTLNLLSLYQGNIDLTPEYNHKLNISWWFFDQFSFTSLFVRIGGGYTKDKISLSQNTNKELIKIMQPVNVPYHYSASSNISFSTPIRRLGIKINLTSVESWNKGINIINAVDNIQTNITHTLKLSVENRRKEKWDVRIGGSVSLTDSKFSISSMNTVFFNTSYYGEIRFTPNDKWSFESEANMVTYNSKDFSESVSIPLLSAGISYFFLKGERASLSLQGFDLLNKHIGFNQIAANNYFMQQEWNTIGRYVMLEFSLRIGK